ncbi:DUF3047 domain-containing protein [Photobacterium sanctipauli]|uniref:DUF3047 domain-containing protein n=1 Tax=Photobacterium sanctipauli TaxID=1342794 RepID=A0A2T3NUB3_9GAMM|nr:DUF3047 domain-containing protein [Photobacterium sanctipauli]PSW19843.1 DUF3047 domain-containing protein [Photobacterium sanctipauli]
MSKTTFLPALLISLSGFAPFAWSTTPVATFNSENLSRWQQRSFVGNTQYTIVSLDDSSVLKAQSNGTASIIAKPYRIDLLKTPYINWSWKVENTLLGLNERTKQGDDYAARVYLVLGRNLTSPSTKVINYVWSSNQAMGANWNNAYVGKRAQMLAVQGKGSPIKTWQQEKRNVYQDLIQLFGDKGSSKSNEAAYRYIDVVAIMTDTDNSQQSATAYYGDIFFTAK